VGTAPAPPVVVRRPPTPPEEPSVRRPAGWVTLGGAALVGGGSIALGLSAHRARDRFYASGFTDRAARDQAEALRTWTNVGWAATAVLAGVGTYLLLTSPEPSPDSPTAGLLIAPGLLGAQGAF
jgi:hypothetical protein